MSGAAFGTFWAALCQALDLPVDAPVTVAGDGALPSVYAVTPLAAASVGVAGWALARLMPAGASGPELRVDAHLASRWFQTSIQPQGWRLPPAWDPIAGDYATQDGWIRLHTNAPHHRAAALRALGLRDTPTLDKPTVAAAVRGWAAAALEAAVVQAGGCAAEMRSEAAWAAHPQGAAVQAEPLVHWDWKPGTTPTELPTASPAPSATTASAWQPTQERPLAGLRVLDLTRVLAGPIGTRFLAGYGADVLRLDPPGWDEPSVAPDVTLGKRCARLDLRTPAGAERLAELLAQADVLVHGYRANALEALGFDAARRRAINPALVDVSLNAYGWTGPWRDRRGFDSLVQMSSGIAEAGMRLADAGQPRPLPVQALDHATGYLLAAAVLRGLKHRQDTGAGSQARTSLAAVAALLCRTSPAALRATPPLPDLVAEDWQAQPEATAWGPALRLQLALQLAGTPAHWVRPAGPLGQAPAAW